jgi:hypothetical protein
MVSYYLPNEEVRKVTIKHIASRINIFAKEYVCFTITELAAVKDADFDHGSHLLSWNQKNPPQTQRTESEAGQDRAAQMTTRCRWHAPLPDAQPVPHPGHKLKGFGIQL